MLIVPLILSIFYTDVGTLAGYLGSVAGLGCIYVLPTVTHLKALYTEIDHPILSEALKSNSFTLGSNDTSKSP